MVGMGTPATMEHAIFTAHDMMVLIDARALASARPTEFAFIDTISCDWFLATNQRVQLLFNVFQTAMESLRLVSIWRLGRTNVRVFSALLNTEADMPLSFGDAVRDFSLIDSAFGRDEVSIATSTLVCREFSR